MKNLVLIVFVCLSSVFMSQATELRSSKDYSASKEIQLQNKESGKVKWFDEKKGMGW